ncbi:hypothetical protein ISCGN_015966 [Ixodes scapularis]
MLSATRSSRSKSATGHSVAPSSHYQAVEAKKERWRRCTGDRRIAALARASSLTGPTSDLLKSLDELGMHFSCYSAISEPYFSLHGNCCQTCITCITRYFPIVWLG